MRYLQPGKPDQHVFIKQLNYTYQTRTLNASESEWLDQL